MKKIHAQAQISKTAVIHDDVIIEEGAIIHDYAVIYPNTIVHKNVEIYDHCVLGKVPTSPGCVERDFKEEYCPLEIGEGSILCPSVVLYTGTIIGSHTLLGDFCSIREECMVGDHCIISRNVSINYNTHIGNNTKVMDNTHLTGDMRIGNNVFISVLVASTNDNTMGREAYNEDHVYGAVIEDDVTIGAAANILPNVTIGKNATVGAGSVVTKDVPKNALVMGIPAKIIRFNDDTKEEGIEPQVQQSLYHVGDQATYSKTVSESDVYLYAGLTGDNNPAHINDEQAKQTPFKKRISHGMLTAGFISTVLGTKLPGPGTIYLGQDLKFKKPVYFGDTITAKVTIKEIKSKNNIMVLDTQCFNQKKEIVIEGTATVKLSEEQLDNRAGACDRQTDRQTE